MSSPRFQLTTRTIKRSLDVLADGDARIAHALEAVGYPEERRQPQGYEAFVRIIVGQQVSTHAARAIGERLREAVGGELSAEAVNDASDITLRNAGLSNQKVSYLRALTSATLSSALPIATLSQCSDEEAVQVITAVRGFGVWSAHMYLMFSLGRTNIWPVGDLAVRAGCGNMFGLEDRPTPAETLRLGEPYQPHRSALALLCWKYYSEAPL